MAGRKKKNVENSARDKERGLSADDWNSSRGNISRDEFQLRKSQLEDIQARAHDVGDLRVELAAIQELNKLCGLYSEPVENGESAAVEIARLHLEGTGVVEKGLPFEELARRIAAVVAQNLDALKIAYE